MVNPQLLEYVRQQLASGVSRENISRAAAQGGWQAQDMQEVFAAIEKPAPSLKIHTPGIGTASDHMAAVPGAYAAPPSPALCPYCHQTVLPTYYFCPNCGNKLISAPLSTSIATQVWIYVYSAFLPLICYITISKWPGIKYYKSKDEKTKQIGTIAIVILVLSTVITVWLAYIGTQALIQSQVNSINADMSAQGS